MITLLDEYQKEIEQFAIYPQEYGIVYCALGLGEAGEAQGELKKAIREGGFHVMPILNENPDSPNYGQTEYQFVIDESFKDQVLDECGDTLWYLARISHHLGISLSELAQRNIDKLLDRKARGVLLGKGNKR